MLLIVVGNSFMKYDTPFYKQTKSHSCRKSSPESYYSPQVFLSRLFDLAAASKLRLLHRSVPPPPAGLAGVGRGGEPDLWVEISIKVVFSKD
jgi:hypothetical protein